ncbi:MAG: hypothetical protein ACREN1_09030, partial [Candidatus Dormibacteria bacterium]
MSQDRLRSLGTRLQSQSQRSRWYTDPALWARECIEWPDGQGLADYQEQVLRALAADHRVASRSPHAAGKTATNALALLWFALTRDQAGMNWKAL